MNQSLQKLINTNIVSSYQETYGFASRIRNAPLFLQDRRYIVVEDRPQDLLDRMIEESQFNHQTQIVEQYKPHRGFTDEREFRKLIATSSSQPEQQPMQNLDSSAQGQKVVRGKDYDTDEQRSDSSDFSRKQLYQQQVIAIEEEEVYKQSLQSPRGGKMQIERVEQREQKIQTPQKPKPQRYPARSARKQNQSIRSLVPKTGGCNCKKSHCLKMYCECFQAQVFCGQDCSCKGCGNMQKTVQQQHAILQAFIRNPKAFEDQNPEKVCHDLGIDPEQVKKGCKCKKTHCLKKYCECYSNGQKCSLFCKCEGCQNGVAVEPTSHEMQV